MRKYANAKAEVLSVKGSSTRVEQPTLSKLANFEDYATDDGYIYLRVRAISSRVNKNYDGWPSTELKKSYSSFIGKPFFVDHHNHDPRRARGVVVDAEIHEDDAKTSALDPYYSSKECDPSHLPPTWVELLVEIDAKQFPKLAKAITSGDMDSVSMGADVLYTVCSVPHCANRAEAPEDFCEHVRNKGAYYDSYIDGQKISKLAYENCFDVGFFELSGVFDPADETALALDLKTARRAERVAAMDKEAMGVYDQEAPDPEDFTNPPVDESGAYVEPASSRFDEEQQVLEWRRQQFINLGYPPEQADALAQNANVDWHDVEKLIGRGATPDQATRIMASTGNAPFCPACDSRLSSGSKVVDAHCKRCGWHTGVSISEEEPKLASRYASVATRQRKKIAQDEARMPQAVDTLREDRICEVCGSEKEGPTCDVCGAEEAPEGFNEPDLERARELREQLRGGDEQQPQQPPAGGAPMPGGPMAPGPGIPGPAMPPAGGRLPAPRRPGMPGQPPGFFSNWRVEKLAAPVPGFTVIVNRQGEIDAQHFTTIEEARQCLVDEVFSDGDFSKPYTDMNGQTFTAEDILTGHVTEVDNHDYLYFIQGGDEPVPDGDYEDDDYDDDDYEYTPRNAKQVHINERPLLPATRQNTDKPIVVKTLKDPKRPTESSAEQELIDKTVAQQQAKVQMYAHLYISNVEISTQKDRGI